MFISELAYSEACKSLLDTIWEWTLGSPECLGIKAVWGMYSLSSSDLCCWKEYKTVTLYLFSN